MLGPVASGHANGDAPRAVRFGVFEFDSRARELRKHGVKLKLQGKPFQVLQALLERPGELVTREELRQRLWPSDVFVDFEQGLNTAANRLRIALGDSAENPRYVETLARAGYRFIAPVQILDAPGAPLVDVTGTSQQPQPSAHSGEGGGAAELSGPQPSARRGWPAVGGRVLLLTVATAALLVGVVAIWLDLSQPSPADFHFRPVTFRRGQVGGARFAQDGHGVLYTASWEDGRRQLGACPVNASRTDRRSCGLSNRLPGHIPALLCVRQLSEPADS